MATKSELAIIQRIAKENIAAQEQAFLEKYSQASRDELLAYVRECAKKLDGIVFTGDIIGEKLLLDRFGGSWNRVLAAAGIAKKPMQERLIQGSLYSREARRLEWCVDKTREALAEQEAKFTEKYNGSSKEELLQYIKQFVAEQGYVPAKLEIIGGEYLAQVFGDWNLAVRKAGLPEPKVKCKRIETGRLFRHEFERQEAVYERYMQLLIAGKLEDRSVILSEQERKAQRHKEMQEQKVIDLAVKSLAFKEKLFAAEYAKASDMLLLLYLRECAKELGHLPYKCEVIGGDFIEKRFGGWEAACSAIDWQGEVVAMPKPEDRLIYTRELTIQQHLLDGKEAGVSSLYSRPLVEKMQAGNIYHLLRWAPYAVNGADRQCLKMAREKIAPKKSSRSYTDEEKELLTAEVQRLKKIYNKTLEALDLQERRFAAEHKKATNKELLAYLHSCVLVMNSSPALLDFVGGEYLRRRLGGEYCSWSEVLKKAKIKQSRKNRPVHKCRAFKTEFQRQEQLYKIDWSGADDNEDV